MVGTATIGRCVLIALAVSIHALWTAGTPGGSEGVRITRFDASSAEVAPGQRATLCYGVENARAVAIQPPVEVLEPSRSRCFPVAPSATTTYVLYAEGENGAIRAAYFTVVVKTRTRPRFLLAARRPVLCFKS